MCLLCDDEKAYQAYMNYLDAMERQGKAADPDKAMDAVLDQLEAADQDAREPGRSRQRQDACLRSSAARSINDTDLTSLTLAEARDGLANKSFTVA